MFLRPDGPTPRARPGGEGRASSPDARESPPAPPRRRRLRLLAFPLAASLFLACARENAFEAGVRAFERGDYRTAIERLERHVRESPRHVPARIYLGRAFAARRDFERAHRQYAIVRQHDPAAADGYYYDAFAHLEEGRLRLEREEPIGALEALDLGVARATELVSSAPGNARAFELLGTLQLNRFSARMLAARQLLHERFGPDGVSKRLRSTYEAIYAQEFAPKRNALLASLQDDGFPGVAALAVEIEGAKSAFDQAKQNVQQALTLDGNLSTAALALAQLWYAVGRKPDAEKACRQLLQIKEEGQPDDVSRIRRDKVRGRFLLVDLLVSPAEESESQPDARKDRGERRRRSVGIAGEGAADATANDDAERLAKDLEEPIAVLRQVLESRELAKEDEIEARARLCELHQRAGDLEQMAKEANALYRLDRSHPAANLFRGMDAEAKGRIDQAAEWLRQGLVGRFADFADGHLALARALSKQQKNTAALDALTRCLRVEPRRKEARILRAEIFARLQWFADAQSEVEALLRQYPSEASLQQMVRDFELRQLGKVPESPVLQTPEEARAVLARDRTNSYARLRLVEMLLQAGKLGEALEEARELAEANPTSYVAERLIGLAYLASRDFRRAERSFARAISLQKLLPECYADLGRTLLQQGKYARGVNALRMGLRRDPTSVSIAVELARLYAEKAHPRPARRFIESLALPDPRPAEIRCVEGEIALAEGHLSHAAETFRALLAEKPEFALPRLALARVYIARGERESAIETLKSFLMESEDDLALVFEREVARRLLLREELAAGRAGQAIETAKFMRRHGDPGGAAAVLARFYQDRGDDDVALAHCRMGLGLGSGEADLNLVAATVAERQGNLRRAIDQWTLALQSDPTLAQARLALADAFRRSGRSHLAMRSYQKALSTNPLEPGIYRGLALLLPDEARKNLDAGFSKALSKLDRKFAIFGIAALRARIALLDEDAARARSALEAVSPFRLAPEEREALALLRVAAGDHAKAAWAFEAGPGVASELASNPVRAQALALAGIEWGDLAAAEAACMELLGPPLSAAAPAHEGRALGLHSRPSLFEWRQRVLVTLACVRLLDGRPEEAASIVDTSFAGDERRDLVGFVRLLAAHPKLLRDGAESLVRVLAYAASPFTLGLAIPEAENLRRVAPGHPLPFLVLATLRLERGERRAAERLLTEAIYRNSDHAPSVVRRASLLAGDGRVREAWNLLAASEEACDQSVDLHVAMGQLAARARKLGLRAHAPAAYYRDALEAAERQGAAPRVLASLYGLVARSLAAVQETSDAIVHAREACHLAPHDLRSRLRLAQLLFKKGAADEVESLASQIQRDFPRRPEGFLLEARVRRQAGDLEDARVVLETCLRKVDPFFVDARLELAAVLEEIGDGEALAELETLQHSIVLLHPGQIEVQRKLAERAQKSAKPADLAVAGTHLREALLFDPKDREALASFLRLAIRRSDWKEANRAVAKARGVHAGDPEIRFLMGEVFRRQGLLREALVEFLAAAELAPGNASVHLALAEIYLEREMPDRSREEAARALELDPDFEAARKLLEGLQPEAPQAPRRRRPGAR